MNLTINEQLMHDTKDAHLCIFIANLATWIRTNAKKDDPAHRNMHDGTCWSYNSIQEFVTYFGFWSTQNMRTIIAKSIKLGLVKTSTFNRKKYDNTLWYTLTEKGFEYYPHIRDLVLTRLVDSNKGLVSSNNAIPENTTHCSNNTITTNSSSKQKPNELMRELIEVYREEFPNNPQPHKTLLSTSLEKVLRGLIKRWPEADPHKRPINPEAFRQYMKALKALSPQFALGEYETKNGRKKKNGLETFCRWDNFVKFLENQYS